MKYVGFYRLGLGQSWNVTAHKNNTLTVTTSSTTISRYKTVGLSFLNEDTLLLVIQGKYPASVQKQF